VRILSLLPSATEIVCALGLEDQLVGVTHECDWPEAVGAKPKVTASVLEAGTDPAEVDRRVAATVTAGDPIYRLDRDMVRRLRPDLVITQDLCAVCAVPSGHVHEALDALGCSAPVLSLDPSSLDEVLDSVVAVGRATGTEGRALELVDGARRRLDRVREAVAGARTPPTFALEWSDPPFNGGHWVPEMIALAGGESVLGSRGAPSVRLEWDRIDDARPEVVLFMPCGYHLPEAVAEGVALLDRPALAGAGRIVALDASAFFSRPGPRLVDGVEILAAVLHPGRVTPPPGPPAHQALR